MGLKAPAGRVRVSQFVAHLAQGDAVSMDCLELGRILGDWGMEVDIYASSMAPQVSGRARPLEDHQPSEGELVVLHYSLWSPAAAYVRSLRPRRLVLIYHNITPPEYFRGMNTQAEEATRKGKQALAGFAPTTTLALGDSEFNRRELEALGFAKTGVLPIALDLATLDSSCNEELLSSFNDGYVNLLSVGRIAPNKRLEDVIKVFYHYKRHINPRCRLFLVGTPDIGVPYLRWLENLVEHLGLEPDVHLPGWVSSRDLLTYYRLAHAYLCMSEHEGFCVPIVESMYLGVPVIAYASTAVPYTLGDGGILVHRKDYAFLAELVHLLLSDGGLRERLVANGRARAALFARERVGALLAGYLAPLLGVGLEEGWRGGQV